MYTSSGTAVKNVVPQEGGFITFEHDQILENVGFVFNGGSILGQGKLLDEDLSGGDEVTNLRIFQNQCCFLYHFNLCHSMISNIGIRRVR